MSGRPGLQEALQAVERGAADALIVAKLDRLSRSLLDFASLMERGRKRG
jgi:DNA invertase Pin-like site-specific DNA recombinase